MAIQAPETWTGAITGLLAGVALALMAAPGGIVVLCTVLGACVGVGAALIRATGEGLDET